MKSNLFCWRKAEYCLCCGRTINNTRRTKCTVQSQLYLILIWKTIKYGFEFWLYHEQRFYNWDLYYVRWDFYFKLETNYSFHLLKIPLHFLLIWYLLLLLLCELFLRHELRSRHSLHVLLSGRGHLQNWLLLDLDLAQWKKIKHWQAGLSQMTLLGMKKNNGTQHTYTTCSDRSHF